jgi:hypothetical protein
LVLAAAGCSNDKPSATGTPKKAGSGLNLLVVTPEAVSGQDSRLAFVMQDDQREFVKPDRVVIQFGQSPEQYTGPRVEAVIHDDAEPAPPYMTVTANLSPPGGVWVRAVAGDRSAIAPIKIVPALTGLAPGKPLPSVATPTPTNEAGVSPICTADPQCPWHTFSLDQRPAGKPMAVLVATPAFCQTAVCGPVLEILRTVASPFADRVEFVHLEVYSERPKGRIEQTPTTPAVKAFGLSTEPILFLVGPDGVVRERIDGIYGRAEATQALERLAG